LTNAQAVLNNPSDDLQRTIDKKQQTNTAFFRGVKSRALREDDISIRK
jgi:hypothetical protein